ncbi:hypothetical protein M9H77_06183 [Catharanthus roseus]|uniref:Uncharacterized protein n=1 Tax=Catharanthus roseus TaxID=4058 RepID=A0ACC0BRE5_CATRO|nr:hypothetical protein M9H77_06183 [Catharanthus roseus]
MTSLLDRMVTLLPSSRKWNLVGIDFCGAIVEFFSIVIVSLIPKKKHSKSVGDFRPISCCNVFYKVITKLLASRLGKVLLTFIDGAESAFVEGRSMVEDIHLAQDFMRGYARKRTSPKFTLKVDL